MARNIPQTYNDDPDWVEAGEPISGDDTSTTGSLEGTVNRPLRQLEGNIQQVRFHSPDDLWSSYEHIDSASSYTASYGDYVVVDRSGTTTIALPSSGSGQVRIRRVNSSHDVRVNPGSVVLAFDDAVFTRASGAWTQKATFSATESDPGRVRLIGGSANLDANDFGAGGDDERALTPRGFARAEALRNLVNSAALATSLASKADQSDLTALISSLNNAVSRITSLEENPMGIETKLWSSGSGLAVSSPNTAFALDDDLSNYDAVYLVGGTSTFAVESTKVPTSWIGSSANNATVRSVSDTAAVVNGIWSTGARNLTLRPGAGSTVVLYAIVGIEYATP